MLKKQVEVLEQFFLSFSYSSSAAVISATKEDRELPSRYEE